MAKYIRKYNLVNPNFKIIRLYGTLITFRIFEALENKMIKFVFNCFLVKVKYCDKKYIHSLNKSDINLYAEDYVKYLNRSCKNIIKKAFTHITILSNISLFYKVFTIKDIFSIDNKKETVFSFIRKKLFNLYMPSCNVIFHIHGGGFFSQTTESSKVFLNE